MIALGIAVRADLQARWRGWLAPEVQPFFVDSIDRWPTGALDTRTLSPELRDTYTGWRVDRSLELLWLDEAAFLGMPRADRAELVRLQAHHRRGAVPSVRRWSDVVDPGTLRAHGDGRRFVWWPSLVAVDPGAILSRVMRANPDGAEADALPSRHLEVHEETWDACAGVLPAARTFAGSFPPSSGPNCFATVMAAAGVAGVAAEWMLQAPFEEWLASACRPGGGDGEPGTVLVWRDSTRAPVHAAVTIGDGWALEKASQEWWTPRAVRTARDVIRTSRANGRRLERHRVVGTDTGQGQTDR